MGKWFPFLRPPISVTSRIAPPFSSFTSTQVGCPDPRPNAGCIGELELPPVADPALLLCPLRVCVCVCVQREAWMLPTQREGVCSYRLMWWLIDLQPLYSFTTGLEIQHCTWGAMCVPSLSPFQSFPRSSFLCRFRLSSCCWVWAPANSPWRDMPQVGIITSAASGAHLVHTPTKAQIVWNFPNLLLVF